MGQVSKIYDNKSSLYVFVMSHIRFRVNPYSVVARTSRNSLLEVGMKSEVQVTATGLKPRTS